MSDTPSANSADDSTASASAVSPAAVNDGGSVEPSLGPACLVVSILSLAIFCAVCGIGSWFVFSDQYPYAEKGITKQLIPWVATSQLAEADKRSITQQLNALVPILQNREIDTTQLTRLHFCLQDNPVLLWGAVQSIELQAPEAGLSETELTSLTRITQRLLRMAANRQLGRRDLEFSLQNCSEVRADGASIETKQNLTAEQIRDFMTRAEQLVVKNEVPNEPYEKTPAEVFAILIDHALNPPIEPAETRK
ncbi:MAG: hypothetical protein KDA72_06500 [Planctomycetales bacterium]|nr:hypothetical protein [Planctomycetales bacterium]